MVFNLHDQFEQLRAAGKYENMREKIMVRDEAVAGSRNPILARHGEASEARQYSGRMVDEGWRCPFQYSGSCRHWQSRTNCGRRPSENAGWIAACFNGQPLSE